MSEDSEFQPVEILVLDSRRDDFKRVFVGINLVEHVLVCAVEESSR